MLNELIILANDFDQKGLRKEADSVDFLIRKFAEDKSLWTELFEIVFLGKIPDDPAFGQSTQTPWYEDLKNTTEAKEALEKLEDLKNTPEAKKALEKLWEKTREDALSAETVKPAPDTEWSTIFSGNDPRRTGRDDSITDDSITTASLVGGLVKLANHLDQKGLRKEADLLDRIIRENF